MKITNFLVPLMALMLLTACDRNVEVKQFMNELATAVSTNDKAAIEKMYPDATKADSLSLTFDADKAQIEELEDGGWKVDLGEGKDIIVVKNEADGTFSVKESHGIFAIDVDTKSFYEALGCYDPKLNDSENAERMRDTLFMDYLAGEFEKKALENIELISYSPGYSSSFDGYITPKATIKNNNDFDIPAGAYTLIADSHFSSDGPTTLIGRKKLSNQEVPKHSQAVYTFKRIIADMEWYEFSLDLNLKDLKLLKDYYQPTSSEYNDYLESKKAGVHSSSENETQYDFVCQRPLTDSDLIGLSPKELRIMRNWIYARHGYIFKSPDLQDYFGRMSWYSPQYSDVSSMLSETEKDNVYIIKSYE